MSLSTVLSSLTALIAVIAMVLLARHGAVFLGLSRRASVKAAGLSIAASISLDARRRVTLIDCAGRQVLVMTGGPSDVLLGWLPPEMTAPEPHAP